MEKLIAKLGKKRYEGSNTQNGKAYHTFDGAGVAGQAGNINQRVNLIKKNFRCNNLSGIDLGCSIGGITLSLSRLGAKMSGIDYDHQAIDLARAYAKEFGQDIKYSVKDIDLKVVREINGDFVVWFSQWMWFCKAHGFQAGLDALCELGKRDIVLFFETSLGDGMAGGVMRENKMSEDKLLGILRSCFHKVRKIGVDECWRKRPIFMCHGKSRGYKCYNKTTDKVERIGYNKILKRQNPENYKREVEALIKLKDNIHFPNVIEHDGKNEIVMEYCGEQMRSLPTDWKYQAESILKALKRAKLVHRDISPRNIMIKDKTIKIIDLSWSGSSSELNSALPSRLGTDFRSPDGFDDRYSLYKSLEVIGGLNG